MTCFKKLCTFLCTIFSHQFTLNSVFVGSVHFDHFDGSFSDKTESVMRKDFDSRSSLSCGSECAVLEECVGFHFDDSSRTCELYRGVIFGTSNPASGKIVYRKARPCEGDFETVYVRGKSLCLGLFKNKVAFETARRHCVSLSSRLLHLDDPELKLIGVDALLSKHGYNLPIWVGHDDRAAEDQWVATWSGELLGPYPWTGEEPNNHEEEDCMMRRPGELIDMDCERPSAFVCEI